MNNRNRGFFSKSTMLYAFSLFFPQSLYINLHGKNIPKPQKHPEFDTKSPLRYNSFHTLLTGIHKIATKMAFTYKKIIKTAHFMRQSINLTG